MKWHGTRAWGATAVAWGLACVTALPLLSCGDDDDDGGGVVHEHTGQACSSAEECYDWLEDGALSGGRICLDRVPGGYCTHECETDADCCAAEGECRTSHPQVCAPFESAGIKMCFLSCEQREVEAAGVIEEGEAWDADRYCRRYAWDGFICRSTGGGAENRRVCVP